MAIPEPQSSLSRPERIAWCQGSELTASISSCDWSSWTWLSCLSCLLLRMPTPLALARSWLQLCCPYQGRRVSPETCSHRILRYRCSRWGWQWCPRIRRRHRRVARRVGRTLASIDSKADVGYPHRPTRSTQCFLNTTWQSFRAHYRVGFRLSDLWLTASSRGSS